MAFFRWVNGAIDENEKLPLIINMDECSLAYHMTGIIGTVLRTCPLSGVCPQDFARLGDRRGHITYISSICSDSAFSHILPQVLLGNCQRFAKRILAEVRPTLPGNIFLWREKSAWNNRFLMRKYVKLLCQALGDALKTRAVFLVVDMASCHIHPSIPAFALRRGLRMILVPAGLTCVLQPLDTHVFRSFRSKLQQLWLIHKSRNEGGEVSLQDWLLLVCKTIEEVICGQEWEHAFERDGLVHAQALVSPKLLASLGWKDLPTIGAGLPSIGQAARMFPRRSKANVPMWVQWTAPEAFVRIRTLD